MSNVSTKFLIIPNSKSEITFDDSDINLSLLKKIQELSEEVKELRNENKELKEDIESMEYENYMRNE